jgi:DNA polymerase III delta prime subunit
MSMLASVTRGKLRLPHLLLLYGPDGVGKSTFGSQAPSPIFLGPEKGTMNLDVARFPTPKSWQDVIQALDELANLSHEYKTLVIDTLDWLEPLCYAAICKKYETNSIEKAAGGYGKGFREAFNEMVDFRHRLSFLRESKRMNIILLAHSKVTTFEDPTTEHGYSRYELKLQEGASVSIRAMWREYVDAVLFCNFETFSKGEGKQARGITTRERKMWTERDAGFDAKNRFGLPFEMNLDYVEYDKHVNSTPEQKSDDVIGRIQELLKQVKDESVNQD